MQMPVCLSKHCNAACSPGRSLCKIEGQGDAHRLAAVQQGLTATHAKSSSMATQRRSRGDIGQPTGSWLRLGSGATLTWTQGEANFQVQVDKACTGSLSHKLVCAGAAIAIEIDMRPCPIKHSVMLTRVTMDSSDRSIADMMRHTSLPMS